MSEQAHVNPFSVNAIGLMAPINDDLEGAKKRIRAIVTYLLTNE